MAEAKNEKELDQVISASDKKREKLKNIENLERDLLRNSNGSEPIPFIMDDILIYIG